MKLEQWMNVKEIRNIKLFQTSLIKDIIIKR